MNGTLLALVVLLLSLGATYFFCIRPMRKRNCAMGKMASGAGKENRDRKAEEEVARLKAEIAALRTQQARPGPQ